MLSCKETTRTISEGLDRKLPLRRRIALRLHVMMCSACRAYKRQVEGLNELVSGRFRRDHSSHLPESQSLSEESREKMKAALRNKDR